MGALLGLVLASALAAVLIVSGMTPALAVTGMAATNSINLFNQVPDYLRIQPLDQTTTFYAKSHGKNVAIATFYDQNRIDVAWQDVSQYVKDAAVATEDPRFYQEGGIDLIGTIRGALSTATSNDVQGGSSITQQYVKNVRIQQCDAKYTLRADAPKKQLEQQTAAFQKCYMEASGVTIPRKVQEMRYAIGLDKSYSKDQILLGYLNIVGLGGQVYGVEAAARYYFGTSAKNLTLPQAATLIAIVNNPANLRIDQTKADNPDNNASNGYKSTLDRRNYVLKRMLANHKITQAQYDDAVKTKIVPKITPSPSGCMSANKYNAGFFCNYVELTMLQNPAFGKTADVRSQNFQHGGLNVYTTLNLDLQKKAQAALSGYIPASRAGVNLGATNVSMEVGTGRIVTMVENKKFNDSANSTPGTTALNYATDYNYGGSGGFQTGSSFKAFDLIAWLEAGHSFSDVINANVHSFPESEFASCQPPADVTWNVANDESDEGGYMTVLQATEASVNSAFAMMGTKLNMCDISNAAKALGVHPANPAPVSEGGRPWDIVPPFMIGTNYIAPLTMARAYAGIANGGKMCTEVAIDKVLDASGKSLPVPKSTCKQAIPKKVAASVTWGLQHVLTAGTAVDANPNDGVPIMGKTGTTDYQEENWLVTSTTKVAQATWVGNVFGHVDLRYLDFKGWAGNAVKFPIVKAIDTALNAHYGGGNFPTPDHDMIYGKYVYVPPAPSTSSPAPSSGTKNPPSTTTPPKKGNPPKKP
ncbi:MAG TPA: transglycosylase domain-containing protein [Humibacter sp.]|nr:transglycosylase domain-containing protein [Humibacter sp.]